GRECGGRYVGPRLRGGDGGGWGMRAQRASFPRRREPSAPGRGGLLSANRCLTGWGMPEQTSSESMWDGDLGPRLRGVDGCGWGMCAQLASFPRRREPSAPGRGELLSAETMPDRLGDAGGDIERAHVGRRPGPPPSRG